MPIVVTIFVGLISLVANANPGFSPKETGICFVQNIPSDSGLADNGFYWTRQALSPRTLWFRVSRNASSSMPSNGPIRPVNSMYYFTTPESDGLQQLVPRYSLPQNSSVEQVSCLEVWVRYWKYMSDTAVASDPVYAQSFTLDIALVKKAIIDINRKGTGFYISHRGIFLTAYHVAREICKIPAEGSLDANIDCGDYELLSYPAFRETLVFGETTSLEESIFNPREFHPMDFVLMRAKGKTDSVEKLSFRATPLRRFERAFAVGFPNELRLFTEYEPYLNYPIDDADMDLDSTSFDRRMTFSTGRVWASAIKNYDGAYVSTVRSSGINIEDGVPSDQELKTLSSYDQAFPYLDFQSETEIHVAGGNSGGPMLDNQGKIIGILTFGTGAGMASQAVIDRLDLCNNRGSKNPDLVALAGDLALQGVCSRNR